MSNQEKNPEPAAPAYSEAELEEYRLFVAGLMDEVRRTGGAHAFRNKGFEHARIVVDAMIDNAKDSVRVFAREMSTQVFSLDKLKTFLARNPNAFVDVVVETPEARDSKTSLLSQLGLEIKAGRVRVSIAKQPPPADSNVCITDGIHVRFERNQAKREATVVFGHAQTGRDAIAFFEGVKGAA